MRSYAFAAKTLTISLFDTVDISEIRVQYNERSVRSTKLVEAAAAVDIVNSFCFSVVLIVWEEDDDIFIVKSIAIRYNWNEIKYKKNQMKVKRESKNWH